jgi:palmitoyl-protein thioesterase
MRALFWVLVGIVSITYATRPIVLMHGLLATSEAMSHAQQWIKADFPTAYVKNVALFGGASKLDSLFTDINVQVEMFAKQMLADKNLSQGFNLICHSQGCMITRAYIERYMGRNGMPSVHNYVSWVGPHDGVYGVPDLNYYCPDTWCGQLAEIFDKLLSTPGYSYAIQELFTFAAYWKDVMHIQDYVARNLFLVDINNENPQRRNSSYVTAMESLNSLLLIDSHIDRIVVPNTSPVFQMFPQGSVNTTVPFLQSDTYTQNLIGLKTLYDRGSLKFGSVPCGHQDVPRDLCKQYVYPLTKPYLD